MEIIKTVAFWWLIASAISTGALFALFAWERFRYGHVTQDETTGEIKYTRRF